MMRSSSSPRAVSITTGTGANARSSSADVEPVHAREHEIEHHESRRQGTCAGDRRDGRRPPSRRRIPRVRGSAPRPRATVGRLRRRAPGLPSPCCPHHRSRQRPPRTPGARSTLSRCPGYAAHLAWRTGEGAARQRHERHEREPDPFDLRLRHPAEIGEQRPRRARRRRAANRGDRASAPDRDGDRRSERDRESRRGSRRGTARRAAETRCRRGTRSWVAREAIEPPEPHAPNTDDSTGSAAERRDDQHRPRAAGRTMTTSGTTASSTRPYDNRRQSAERDATREPRAASRARRCGSMPSTSSVTAQPHSGEESHPHWSPSRSPTARARGTAPRRRAAPRSTTSRAQTSASGTAPRPAHHDRRAPTTCSAEPASRRAPTRRRRIPGDGPGRGSGRARGDRRSREERAERAHAGHDGQVVTGMLDRCSDAVQAP